MYSQMTYLSRQAYDAATDEMLTAEDAVRFLEKELRMRSLRSKIDKFAKGRDEKTLKKQLTDGLLIDHPGLSRDSAKRRVRGWMDPNSKSTLRKKDAIEAAFLLGLNLQEADDFIAMVSEERLHWRSVFEIVYIYALNNGLTWKEASAMTLEMQDLLSGPSDPETVSTTVFTSSIRPRIEALHTKDALEAFLMEEAPRLGQYHNQAYRFFTDMMNILQTPVSKEEAEDLWDGKQEKLHVSQVVREYLYESSVLKARDRAVKTKKLFNEGKLSGDKLYVLTRIQKNIADAWPEETLLSKMKHRQKDVNRKVLILLQLASSEDNMWDDEPEETDFFREQKEKINFMLALCGYSPLDPRNPFDWIIIYCITADDLLDMDAKMITIFKKMFDY